jgi:hypothetical protein
MRASTNPLAAATILAAALLAFACGSAHAALHSEYIGAFPEACLPEICTSTDEPQSQPPPGLNLIQLNHELSSQTCGTDKIFIVYEYPENTGNTSLDSTLKNAIFQKFEAAKKNALKMSCEDEFIGCDSQCLPVSFEVKLWFFQSSSTHLSVFEADRFTGNLRQGRHLNSSIKYHFSNYDLSSGRELSLGDVLPEPERQGPLFWKAVEESLKSRPDSCTLDKYLVDGRPAGKDLRKNDFLLSRNGLTLVLSNARPGQGCYSYAIDIPKGELIMLGANPHVWEGQ